MSLLGSVFGLGGMVLGGLIGSIIPGIGTAIGMSVGAAIGGALGGYVGNILFPDKINYGDQPPPKPYENRIQIATYGAAIPITYESVRLAGNIIYMQPIQQTIIHSRHRQDGIRYHQYERIYTSTFAVAFCEGPIEGFRRIWINNDCWIDWSDSTSESYTISEERGDQITIYLGTQAQTADADISAILGAAETPAYKGIAYIVFPNFPLGEYGGMPKIEVEIGPKDTVAYLGECSEDYTGNLSDPIPTDIFSYSITSGSNAYIAYPDDAYFVGACEQYLSAVYEFNGEFDINIYFEIVSYQAYEDGTIKLYFFSSSGSPNSYISYTIGTISGTYYTIGNSKTLDDVTGKIRIVRDSSNDIYAFYWNDSLSRWEWDGNTSGVLIENFSGPLQPKISIILDDESHEWALKDITVDSGCDNTIPI